MSYKIARIGTYYNGHDSKLIDQLNNVLKDIDDYTIVEELFVNGVQVGTPRRLRRFN